MSRLPIRAIVVALTVSILSARSARSATFSLLHNFGVLTNVTGLFPEAPLVQGLDGTLYGTAMNGEGDIRGVVFRVSADGTGFRWLKLFTATNLNDGAIPLAGLAMSGDWLYGTTSQGGSNGVGTVFVISTNGTGFATLHTFTATNGPAATNMDGAVPQAGLVVSNGMVYGTTFYGGTNGTGTVFALQTNGGGYSVLHTFSAGPPGEPPTLLTNNDGAYPLGRLLLNGGTLFGTTLHGGTNAFGTIFSISTTGSGFSTVLQCNGGVTGSSYPAGGLIISGNLLYGTSTRGGTNGDGTVFVVATNGTGYLQLHSFNFNDGDEPLGDLVLAGSTLYGTADIGGANGGGGVVFKVNVDGSGFTNFYNFTFKSTAANGGDNPLGGLVLSNNVLFGSTSAHGSGLGGTLFSIQTNGTGYTNFVSFGYSDAANPGFGLVLSGNRLFGTALKGGAGYGTVFALDTSGANFATLHAFTNGDGNEPAGVMSLVGSTLFGTTHFGGVTNTGTIFSIGTNGMGFTNLMSFIRKSGPVGTNYAGASPFAGVVLAGNTLFGAASHGGANGFGTIFSILTNGAASNTLYNFTITNASTGPGTNTDGAFPDAELLPLGTSLFGTASAGGADGFGSLFAINTNDNSFTNFHSFTGSDGADPVCALITDGSRFYGAAAEGGTGNGTVFAIGIDGSGFTVLHTFSATNGPSGTNADGALPSARLLLLGGKLYGTAALGGDAGYGTVFSLTTNGSAFSTIYNFGFTNGALPGTSLVASGSTLYGATTSGGTVGDGVIFSLSLAPVLNLQPVGGKAVLTWSDPTFSLQSSTNVEGPYATIIGAASPYTNSIGSAEQFFRLKQ